MMIEAVASVLLATGLIVADACVKPTRGVALRSLAGTALLLTMGAGLLGLVVAVTGAWLESTVLVLILVAALALVSNVKRTVLGEPLVFSDLALVGALFQHPQFYLTALKRWQIAALIVGFVVLIAVLVMFSTTALALRARGLALAVVATVGLAMLLRLRVWAEVASAPQLERDVARHGLIATTLVYWHHWRRLVDPPVCDALPLDGADQCLVIVVQCESFADPAKVLGDPKLMLPGLERARAVAWLSGQLHVPGFGAYTMRTEYGVLLGRNEAALGLRRFDPFLTAAGEASWALPRRLSGEDWTALFVHPHDLRFYGRDRLMPVAGFDRLVGEDAFPPPAPGEGRYVTDDALCDKILELARGADRSTLIYAVTIENHGPWGPGDAADAGGGGAQYLRLLRRSDAMLVRLLDALPGLGRPVVLCFFGDHRPSIPGVSEPGEDRDTPFVLMRFDRDGNPHAPDGRNLDLTPDQLHHAILRSIELRAGQG